MGLFGLFGHGKKKDETAISAPAVAQEEPEFLRRIDVAAAREIEAGQAAGEGAEIAVNVKEEAEPELALWLNNGATVSSLKELAAALKKMNAADYKEHVNDERNDLAEWVNEILNDNELASQLRSAKGRLHAARYVEKEISNLKAARRKTEMAAKTATNAAKAAKATKKAGKETAKLAEQTPKTPMRLVNTNSVKTAAEIKPLKPLEEEMKIVREMPKEAPIEESGKDVNEELGEELKLPEIHAAAENEEKANRITKPRIWFWPFKKRGIGDTAPEVPEIPEIPDKEERKLEPFAEKYSEAQTGKQKGQVVQKEDVVPKLPGLEELGELDEEFGMPETPKTGMGEFKLSKDQKAETESAELEPHHARWAEFSEEEKERESKVKTMAEEEAEEETGELPASAAEIAVEEGGERTKTAMERKSHEEAELDRKEDELDRQGKELSNEEAELNANRLDLTRKRYELIKQKGEIERKKFEIFMKKHRLTTQRQEALLAEQPESLPEFAQELKGLPDLRLGGEYRKENLQALLEEAKQHIHQNNVEEAQKALEQAQSAFNTVYMTLNEKKQMEYEILEVEADLKLASLK